MPDATTVVEFLAAAMTLAGAVLGLRLRHIRKTKTQPYVRAFPNTFPRQDNQVTQIAGGNNVFIDNHRINYHTL
jgi:hypothetical protein